MNNRFATLLIDPEWIKICIFEIDGSKVAFIKNISEKLSDQRDHKHIQKVLRDIKNANSDLPNRLFAVWPEYKTLTTVLTDVSGLSDKEITQRVKDKYSLTSQEIEATHYNIDDERTQVTVYPIETKNLYLKYAQELNMEFLGFAPVVLGMEKFAKEREALIALKTADQYILAAVKDSAVYYTETVNSPDPVELVTRLSKAIEFVHNKKEYELNIKKVALIGFPKTPEIKLPSKISLTRKPITIKNLTVDSKSLYLDSIISARLVVKDLPQETAHENKEEEKEKEESSSTKTSAHQLLEDKDKTAMSEEYTNENENEDTLRRLNDSRDYRYYDEETTSWKAWLVGVIIILVVLFLVVGVLARAGYLPFNVPFFSPAVVSQTTLTPTPTPAPIIQSTPTPVESSPSATVKKDEFSVQVQNGSGKAGAAGVVSKALDSAGFDTISATNAPTEDYTSTEIYNVGKASDDFIQALIAELKTAGYTGTDQGSKLPTDVKTSADVVVILGAK